MGIGAGFWFEALNAMVHRGTFAATRSRIDSLLIEKIWCGEASSAFLKSPLYGSDG